MDFALIKLLKKTSDSRIRNRYTVVLYYAQNHKKKPAITKQDFSIFFIFKNYFLDFELKDFFVLVEEVFFAEEVDFLQHEDLLQQFNCFKASFQK